MASPARASTRSSFIRKWRTRPAARKSCRTSCSTPADASKTGTRPARCTPSRIRSARSPQDRNIFFFVSGGVDSTVAYTLCLRALGPERVHGTYVDTGLMREGETEFVRAALRGAWARAHSSSRTPRELFLSALASVTEPEQKRHIIGEEFVRGAAAHSRVASTFSTGTGFSARAPSIPTPSNPAAPPRPI